MLFWKMMWEEEDVDAGKTVFFSIQSSFVKYDKTCKTCEHLNLNIKNIAVVFNNVNMKLLILKID